MLLEEARAFERRDTEVLLYSRGLADPDDPGERAAAATEFRKIIDHKGATWAALAQAPLGPTAAQVPRISVLGLPNRTHPQWILSLRNRDRQTSGSLSRPHECLSTCVTPADGRSPRHPRGRL